VRDRELEHVAEQNPDLDERVARWRAGHPSATLVQAVRDLELWPKNPRDADAQRLVWKALRRLGDPAAVRLGFPAMRRQSVPAVRDAAPVPAGDAATDCAAGTPQAAGETT